MDVLALIVSTTIYSAAPLMLAALGGLFSERSGVVNIGLEGLMVMGAFSVIVTTLTLEAAGVGALSVWIGLLVAAVVGALFSLFHAVASIHFQADQVVSGVALNFLAVGLSVYIINLLYGSGQTAYIENRFYRFNIPGLSDIPVIGPLFFSNVYATSFLAFGLAFLVYYVIYYRPFGLRLRSVGEHPQAADTMGIRVVKMRYIGVMLSGVFAGLGGAVFAATFSGNFSATTITGQGFMALAALIFGKWHPLGVIGATLFFGLAQALGVVGQQLPFLSDVPPVFLLIAPYVLTILALAGFVGRAEGPKALGKPYIKGSR
ncbi:ABC transporter permease [Shouchella clausii]|jgi:general nucleoside transport system permease protein|uniref:ABC transporter permease n=1 Tax=Shouchella clausii TaxID=79880 RepID=UPI0007881AB4|nr:ABC transporter permease [Shouchella clausii]PAD90980.1 ABC transporter permease [Shouchella clausii]GIN14159.1 ABC transporter permease [Shouchella clausii]